MVAATTVLSVSTTALSNGRYPAASQLVVDPNDPKHLVVSATFGLLDSRDDGRSFNWLCESAIGPAGEEGFDIVLAVTGNGNTVLGLFNGMATTPDGCTFQMPSELTNHVIGDLSWRRSTPHQVVGYTVANMAGGFASKIVQSNDDGATWSEVGPPLPTSLLPLTIDLAPSDANRIYLSLMSDRTKNFNSVLMRSDDGGATFQTFDIPGTEQQRLAYIAAVHPTQPDRVYLRVLDDKDGLPITIIYMTDDGGQTFQKIFTGTGELLGFAMSPDGTEFAFGGPGDGLYVGAADGSNLARRSDVQPTSLTWAPQGLYAAADSKLAGFSIGRSIDSGATFLGLFKYQSICGQTACSSKATSVCAAQWEMVAPQLGVTCTAPDAGGADAATDATPGGGLADGAGGASGPSIGANSGGCVISHARCSTHGWTWLAGLLVALRWRRRGHG
jgi:Sortilin, neurotensin receptor 3,